MINLIGITGKISSGKNTVADLIKEHSDVSWEQKGYAHKLKAVCSILLGIPIEKFEDREFKQSHLGDEWGNITVRELLQKVGTDCMRDGLNENVWVTSLFSDYKSPTQILSSWINFSRWIITDVRFANEAAAIKSRGGIIIKVVRPTGSEVNLGSIKSHSSETSLDKYAADHIIMNDGTLEDLRNKVKQFLIENKL